MRVPNISYFKRPQMWVMSSYGMTGVPWVKVQDFARHMPHLASDAAQGPMDQIKEDARDACTDTL